MLLHAQSRYSSLFQYALVPAASGSGLNLQPKYRYIPVAEPEHIEIPVFFAPVRQAESKTANGTIRTGSDMQQIGNRFRERRCSAGAGRSDVWALIETDMYACNGQVTKDREFPCSILLQLLRAREALKHALAVQCTPRANTQAMGPCMGP